MQVTLSLSVGPPQVETPHPFSGQNTHQDVNIAGAQSLEVHLDVTTSLGPDDVIQITGGEGQEIVLRGITAALAGAAKVGHFVSHFLYAAPGDCMSEISRGVPVRMPGFCMQHQVIWVQVCSVIV
jgi:hypothetical protein